MTPAPVRKSIRVKAPRAKAFDVFTARFDTWWPRGHHIGAAEMQEAVIEPRQGGRWYEKGIDGSICQWGEVLVWQPPSRVVLSWRLNSQFKLDEEVNSEVEVRFIADGPDATLVELEHRITAVDAQAIVESVGSPQGWSGLLALYAEKTNAA
ncbi:MAG: SRPBCC family protein [Alphaproteobacteria bacterium]|nr:SRPBCC family protein [Alphaproteobacteria bacterium]